MKPYAQEAENLRLLFLAGIVSVDDVVAWADRTILAFPKYDDDLTEVSLGAKIPMAEMDSRLKRVSEGADHFEAIRNLLGQMHRTLLSDRSQSHGFARLLEHIWVERQYEIPADLGFMGGIDDIFYMAVTGIFGTLEQAIDNLISETARFDTATPVLMHPLPASAPKQPGSSAKAGKGVRERLLRFFRGGRK